MVSSIGNSSVASMMQRPDPSQMASKLFSKLDSKNQGYIEKSDLQSAFDQISGSGKSANVDEVFKKLDGDGDGKITEQEMSDSLTKMAAQLDSQFNSMRMSGKGGMHGMGGMMGGTHGMGGSDGLTKDQLTGMANETDSGSSALTNLISNFDAADTNGDGKVSAQEAMAYNQSTQSSAPGAPGSASSEERVMMNIMQLVRAYGDPSHDSSRSSSTGTLSVSA